MLLRIAVRTPVMLVSSLVMFLSISMDLSPVIIVAATFLIVAFTLIVTNATRVFNRVFDTYDDLNASVQENVGAIRVVKAFVRKVYEKERLRTAAEKLYKLFVRAEGIVALNNPVMMIAINSCIIAVSWLGALFCFVVVCIAVSAYAINRSMLFTQILIDDYIEPMLASGSTDFSGLAGEIMKLGVILVVGVLASYGFNRLMVTIGQGTIKKLREDVFEHMEGLPIRYFDTHAHGDIMSVYTNDVDTPRQFYGQTLPQLVNSTITLVVTFTTMVALSVPLTAISVVMTSWGQVQTCHPSVMVSVLPVSSAESSMPMARARLAATDSPKPLPLAPRAESAW